MNTLRLLLSIVFAAVAALSAPAALESAQLLPHNRQPQYPPGLVLEGITRGRALIAVAIDDEGRVKDLLPLAYSNRHFARVSMEALQDWRFKPARVDGRPVSVQTEIAFDYTLEGAVITANVTNHYLYDRFENLGDNALVYQPADAARLDRPPVRIAGDSPKYAAEAAQSGVRGRVQVRFYIDEKGNVWMPAATTATDPYLMEQAVAAVRSWKFEPVTSHGQPVLVMVEQEFNFGSGR